MFGNRVLTLNPLIGLAATPMPAQSTMPASPPPPATTAPAGKTASLPTAKTPVTKLTNLNTAPAEQLDALPEVGKARTKAILNEHAKGKFKVTDARGTRLFSVDFLRPERVWASSSLGSPG